MARPASGVDPTTFPASSLARMAAVTKLPLAFVCEHARAMLGYHPPPTEPLGGIAVAKVMAALRSHVDDADYELPTEEDEDVLSAVDAYLGAWSAAGMPAPPWR